jgi:hypothetical protein
MRANEPSVFREALLAAVLDAFRVQHRELAPLLAWYSG